MSFRILGRILHTMQRPRRNSESMCPRRGFFEAISIATCSDAFMQSIGTSSGANLRIEAALAPEMLAAISEVSFNFDNCGSTGGMFFLETITRTSRRDGEHEREIDRERERERTAGPSWPGDLLWGDPLERDEEEEEEERIQRRHGKKRERKREIVRERIQTIYIYTYTNVCARRLGSRAGQTSGGACAPGLREVQVRGVSRGGWRVWGSNRKLQGRIIRARKGTGGSQRRIRYWYVTYFSTNSYIYNLNYNHYLDMEMKIKDSYI